MSTQSSQTSGALVFVGGVALGVGLAAALYYATVRLGNDVGLEPDGHRRSSRRQNRNGRWLSRSLVASTCVLLSVLVAKAS